MESWGGIYSGMIRPSLIQDLRTILDEYPDNGQILKELIQNAEDAGASRVKFWYDERNINSDLTDTTCPKHLQGSALYVYNDAQFTAKDWDGIKMLHQSVKAEDPLKVGRFGLGFKSVFHITDYPCVISGENVLLIDPKQAEVSEARVCLEIKLSTCRNFSSFKSAFCGVFGFTEKCFKDGVFKGTIFRFPLRHHASRLSENTYDDNRMEGLFEAFKADSRLVLLFLKSLKSIDLLTSSQTVVFSVSLTDESIIERKTFESAFQKEVVSANTITLTQPFSNLSTAVVETRDFTNQISFQQTWCVATLFLGGDVSEEMKVLLQDKSLSYSPYVGVAFLLETPEKVDQGLDSSRCQGHVFCFLPLPLQDKSMTGLPVLLNGFFALSQNRHHLKWPTADEVDRGWDKVSDKACLWNRCLLNEAIPHVYAMLVKELIRQSESGGNLPHLVKQVYKALPLTGSVDENWETILGPLWHLLLQNKIVYCEEISGEGRWLNLGESVLYADSMEMTGALYRDISSIDDKTDRTVIKVLLMWGLRVCTVPVLLHNRLQQHTMKMPGTISPTVVREILRNKTAHLRSLDVHTKLQLLSYILRDEMFSDLNGIELLPLADKTFAKFTTNTNFCMAVLSPSDDFPCSLFPTLQHSKQFVCNLIDSPSLPELLMKIARSGATQVRPIGCSDFPSLLRQEVANKVHISADQQEVWLWLKQVWMVFQKFFPDNLEQFDGLPLIPVGTERNFNTEVLHHPSGCVLAANQFYSLPPNVSAVIHKWGVKLASTVPDWVLSHHRVLTFRLNPPTLHGVLQALVVVAASGKLGEQQFRKPATKEELESLVMFLTSSVRKMDDREKAVLRTIPMFKAGYCIEGPFSYVSLEQVGNAAPGDYFPVKFPTSLIVLDTSESNRLADELGIRRLSTVQLARDVISTIHNYSRNEKTNFMLHLLRNVNHSLSCLSDTVISLPFVQYCTSDVDKMTMLKALFDPTEPELRDLFLQEDRFPEFEFRDPTILCTLQKLGLKSGSSVKADDLYCTAKYIDDKSSQKSMKNEMLLRKAKSLIAFLSSHSQLLEYPCQSTTGTTTMLIDAMGVLRCVPYKDEKPSYLPQNLPWFQPEKSVLCLPSQIKVDDYECIVCSVMGILPSTGVLEHVGKSSLATKLGWLSKPTVSVIAKQMREVLAAFTRTDPDPYLLVLRKLYDALAACNPADVKKELDNQKVINNDWIWSGSVFCSPAHIYIKSSPGDIHLEPFLYKLPDELKKHNNFFVVLGCRAEQDVSALLDVLQVIKEKHDEKQFDADEVIRERTLVVNILNKLKHQCVPGEISKIRDRVVLPVHSEDPSKLSLVDVGDCTFCDTSWLSQDDLLGPEDDDEENYSFVHEDVPTSTAHALGVTPLIKKLFDADELDLNFGQKEPLTRRLKNLLMHYTDGLSVPKELIQNADDAGATEVCFLYDERENSDFKGCLMNENLADFQGPALWAYNNAVFTNSDFENIVKLSGGTKKNDSTKIGKFGLGFNAVYNLTDVPSFVSRDRFVMFDPHTKNLGRQGVKINVVKKERMIRRLKNQFAPFNGIFGCDFTSEKPFYEGTLFRLPLRTETQARNGEIKDLCYSHREVQSLLKMLADTAGNLILYTQNVRKVSVFHLSATSQPLNRKLLFEVKKETLHHIGLAKRECFHPVGDPRGTVLQMIERMKKHQASKIKIVEFLDISVTLNSEAEIFSSPSAGRYESSSLSWLVTWSASEKANKCSPETATGGVAIPLEIVGDVYQPVSLSNVPYGFTRTGVIYCFLPLPEITDLPVMLNGTFAVESDRRQLCHKSCDDKTNLGAEWNESLFHSDIAEAYIFLLKCLRLFLCKEYCFFKLWPTTDTCKRLPPSFISGFYEKVVSGNHEILQGKRKWTGFETAAFLDSQLHQISELQPVAFRVFEELEKRIGVDVPLSVVSSFILHGPQNRYQQHEISTQMFFKSLLLPNIRLVESKSRNLLILYALDSGDQIILEELKAINCIPVNDEEALKCPSDLLHPEGKASSLYTTSDERFPLGESYCTYGRLKVLESLGMKGDILTAADITERAESIVSLAKVSYKNAVLRFENLIQYLCFLGPERLIRIFNKEDLRTLEAVQFVPMKQRPSSWPSNLPWKADERGPESLECPGNLHHWKIEKCVATTRLLIAPAEYNQEKILRWMGVCFDAKLDDVRKQLENLSLLDFGSMEINQHLQVERIYEAIYGHLQLLITEGYDLHDIKCALQGNVKICVDRNLVVPSMVAISMPFDCDCSPFLLKVSYSYDSRFRQALLALGVKQEFDEFDVQCVMDSICNDLAGKVLKQDEIRLVIQLARFLTYLRERTHPGIDCSSLGDIGLPDHKGILAPAHTLCFDDDCSWLPNGNLNFIHREVPRSVAETFGVKTKQRQTLNNYSHELPFGQHEELTNRLSRIIEGYPCDQTVLKELLQNADDAGATEIHFIKDFRTHPDKKVFCDSWKPLQGPAICVYNDQPFTTQDLIGIQKLGEGSKRDDPNKTGQYGVGFNAVYHLTDAPSFLTVGGECEDSLCILDPHGFYIKDRRGTQFTRLPELRLMYPDVFHSFLDGFYLKNGMGTLFRFPLRNDDMAEQSTIKKKAVSKEDVTKLFDDFKTEAREALLFVTNIQSIKFIDVSDGQPTVEYSITTTIADTDVQKMTEFKQHMKTAGKNLQESELSIEKVGSKELEYFITTEDNTVQRESWLIKQWFGFPSGVNIPKSVQEAWHSRYLGLLPHGGIAVPWRMGSVAENCRVFCYLPLPISTGLPVVVHGHFALDYESRRNLWKNVEGDYRADWNKYLLTEVLAPLYVSSIESIKFHLFLCDCPPQYPLEIKLKEYHKFLPHQNKASDIHWKMLTESVYKCMDDGEHKLFPLVQGHGTENEMRWLSPVGAEVSKAYFNTLSQQIDQVEEGIRQTARTSHFIEVLQKTILDVGFNLTVSPICILENLRTAGVCAAEVHPDSVISFLQTYSSSERLCKLSPRELPVPLKETHISTVESLQNLIRYCARSEIFLEKLDSLPVLLTIDGVLRCFELGRRVYVSHFSDILKESNELFLHRDILEIFHSKDLKTLPPPLIWLTIEEFARILPQCLNAHIYGCNKELAWVDDGSSKTGNKKWLRRVLKFLSTELISTKRADLTTERTDSTMLEALSDWSLIPARAATCARKPKLATRFLPESEFDYELKLVPFGQRKKVFNFSRCLVGSQQRILTDILRKLHVLELDWSVASSTTSSCSSTRLVEFLSKLAVTTEDPQSVLSAVYDRLSICCYDDDFLSPEEGTCLLRFFKDSLGLIKSKEDHVEIIKRIPCFVTIYNKCVTVQGKEVFVIPHGMPHDGIEHCSEQYDLVLLKKSLELEDLYVYLGFSQVSTIDLYLRYILSVLLNVDATAIQKHMEYIRDHVLKKAAGDTDYNIKQLSLIKALKDLPFIQDSDGVLRKASHFYDHRNPVMPLMLPSSKFLQKPFNDSDWKDFMRLLGLVTDISLDMFVQFAEDVAQEGDRKGVTDDVLKKSRLLIQHMFKRPNICYEGLLEKVARIRFLIPQVVPRELSNLHDQFGLSNGRCLICFEDATSGTHENLLWTSSYLLSKSCDPTRLNGYDIDGDALHRNRLGLHAFKEIICSRLKASPSPKISKVLDNMQNLSTKLGQNLQRHNNERTSEMLIELFAEMYRQLQDNRNNLCVNTKYRLLQFPWLFLPDHLCFARPNQVVLEMESSKELVPYLFKCPPDFGPYQSLFEFVGATKSLSANTYVHVLKQIFDEAGGSRLHPNEAKAALAALLGLFQALIHDKGNFHEVPEIYFLTSDNCLADSTTTVFSDNPELRVRVNSLHLPFVAVMEEKLNEDPITVFNAIPMRHRPRLLTETVQEKVEEESRMRSSQTSRCMELQRTIASVEMQNGVARLLKDEWQDKPEENVLMTVNEILRVLSSLKLFSVHDLSTSLFYGGNKISGSETQIPFHSESQFLEGSRSELHIFIEDTVLNGGDTFMVYTYITQGLDKAFKEVSRKFILHFSMMLSNPNNVSSYLDRLRIRITNPHVSIQQRSFLPLPGSFIPQEWHRFLDYGFCFFEKDEYVGYELDDPLNDGLEGDPTYIYAIIVERVDDGISTSHGWQQKYRINVGTDTESVIVQATDLFKLIRPTTQSLGELVPFEGIAEPRAEPVQSQSLEEVKAEIFNTLKDAWDLDEKTRRKVIKRLIFKWHPDKNIGNEEFCTKVTQYIQQIIHRFESGNFTDITEQNKDSTDGSDSYWVPPRTSTYYSFFNATNSRSRRHRDYQESGPSFGSYAGYGAHSRSYCTANPQPGWAKKWIRQAISDWNAVINDEDGPRPSPLWVCFKCQQVVEKALKAALYARNADSSSLKSHNLSEIAGELAISALSQIVVQLDDLLGHRNYLRMRYPDTCSGNQIPADLFSYEQAQVAKQLTQIIIEEIKGILPF